MPCLENHGRSSGHEPARMRIDVATEWTDLARFGDGGVPCSNSRELFARILRLLQKLLQCDVGWHGTR